jgi:hypothetical protein
LPFDIAHLFGGFLEIALERRVNAAMLRDAATMTIALGFSVAFGFMGAAALTAVLVMRFVRRTSQQPSDSDGARANKRRARLGE